jgi:hypothetical protein
MSLPEQREHGLGFDIICFKIKNLPTLHSTSKSVFESVRKTWGYERKLLTVILVVVHGVF